MSERTIIIGSIVILGLALLGGGGAIWFLNGILSDRQAERQTLEEQLKKDKEKVEALEDKKLPNGAVKKGLKTQSAELDEEIKAGEERIPNLDEEEFDAFVRKIDDLRKQANVFVKDAKWSPGARGSAPPTMFKAKYDISASGGFFDLLRFLNFLETSKRFINVENFSINVGNEGDGKAAPKREMRVTVSTLLRKPTTPKSAVTTDVKTEEKGPQSTPLPD